MIGAGLAGASVACALARRGWQVQVLDAAPTPATGASALPAGLMAPHLSADDNLLSRLTRAGLQATRAELDRLSGEGLLVPGTDWEASGVLEHRVRSAMPPALPEEASGGSRPADAAQRAAAGLPGEARAVWHPQGGWVKPAALVRAWLATPGIAWRGNAQVARLERSGRPGPASGASGTGAQACDDLRTGACDSGHPARGAHSHWQALDAEGRLLAEAPVVVIAAALGSAPLSDLGDGPRLRLQPVRGQVSSGLHTEGLGQALPPFPVNGNGHLLTAVPLPEGVAWLSGSSYGHGETTLAPREADHAANWQRLRALFPAGAADVLADDFTQGRVRAWTGVRCASTDRRPLVGPIAAPDAGLWVCTALGSRGLTLSALCARLLVARLMGETLPLPASLAEALDVGRQAAPRQQVQ